ncbi:MAG: hypothetical protein ABW118_13980 [Candidatus Thiodiazotropha sp.]
MSDQVVGNFDNPLNSNTEQQSENNQSSNGVKHLYLDNDLVPDRDVASRWYGDVDSETAKMNLDTTLDHIVESDPNLLSMNREASADELRKFMTYLDLNRDEKEQFVAALNNGLSTHADDKKGWQKETRRVLNREYGQKAGDRLQAAEAAVTRYSDLGKFLKKHNLGRNPELVRLIAKKAPGINSRYEK